MYDDPVRSKVPVFYPLMPKRFSYAMLFSGLMTSAFHRSVFDEIGMFDSTPFGGDAEFSERFLAYYTGELLEPDDVINSYLVRSC